MSTHSALLQATLDGLGNVLLGKEQQLKLALACLLAKGHLLLEDLPGMGKTTLAHALAHALGLEYNRVQFTNDMLPADLLGVSVFDPSNAQFDFHPGPVFTQLLLADEINRTTPKTQSALLEAMEEGQVSIEGKTRPLPKPFFVIATQNPINQSGTFPLPESQLDRFLMRVSLGYPTPAAERLLLQGVDPRENLKALGQCISAEQLADLQGQVKQIHVSEHLLDYIQRLVQHTRDSHEFSFGVSPRGSLALLQAAKAWAFIDGREHVVPEDIQTVMPSVMSHRLRGVSETDEHAGNALVERVLNCVDVVRA